MIAVRKFLKSEFGMGTVEGLVIAAILCAMAMAAIPIVRAGVSAPASTITTKAINAVNGAGTITSW